MGNEASVIKNLDKRTARREHAKHFKFAIQRWRAVNDKAAYAETEGAQHATIAEDGSGVRDMRVCVRKRPIFPKEIDEGEYDVVSGSCTGVPRVVVHDARMHSDMRHMFINHHSFGFDAVFSEQATSEHVYSWAGADIIRSVVKHGVTGTIMVYGQTGSGKTYTMTSIYELAARDVFRCLEEEREGDKDSGGDVQVDITMTFVELAGEASADMLNGGHQAQLLTAKDGAVHAWPVVEVTARDADDLATLIKLAASLRATQATGVHDKSSRSHAICRVYVQKNKDAPEGVLQLIDLAGSEHRIDSAEHDAQRRKEGAQINSSLSALKECIRAKAAGAAFIPYRKAKLTHLLRACFNEGNPTVVIATVSPSSKDTEHSLNTLRHACIMDGQGDGNEEGGRSFITGGQITKEDLGELDVTQLARERRVQRIAENDKGAAGDRGKNAGQGVEWVKPPAKEQISNHEAQRQREREMVAAERKALRSLAPERLKLLQKARSELGNNTRQQRRMFRMGTVAAVPESEQPVEGGEDGGSGHEKHTDDGASSEASRRVFDGEGRRTGGSVTSPVDENANGGGKRQTGWTEDAFLPEGEGGRRDGRGMERSSAGRRRDGSADLRWGAGEGAEEKTEGVVVAGAGRRERKADSGGRERGRMGGQNSGQRERDDAKSARPPLPRSSRPHSASSPNSCDDVGGDGVRDGSHVSSRGVAAWEGSGRDRHEEVARRREEALAKQRAALEQKVEAKQRRVSGGAGSGPRSVEDEIVLLEGDLATPGLSAAKVHSLKKQIALKRAELLRVERKEAQRRAELQAQTAASGVPSAEERPIGGSGARVERDDEDDASRRGNVVSQQGNSQRQRPVSALEVKRYEAPEMQREEEAEVGRAQAEQRRAVARPAAVSGRRPVDDVEGVKHLDNDIEAMLLEDAEAYRELCQVRRMKGFVAEWKKLSSGFVF